MGVSKNSHYIDRLTATIADSLADVASPGQHLSVGFSGGVDSVVLLHSLIRLGWSPTAVHIHHGLSANADTWADFCRSVCRDWQVELTIKHVCVRPNRQEGLEAAARRARHQIFQETNADWIALGHHQGDRAETILLNLLRGAGVQGLGAMPMSNKRIIRPLLKLSRKDIYTYAECNGLIWVNDESNLDTSLTRNFLRHKILPQLTERFPAVERRLVGTGDHMAEVRELLNDLAIIDLSGEDIDFPIKKSLLEYLPEPRGRNVLRYLLSRHGIGIPSSERLREMLHQFVTAAPDRHPEFSFGDFRVFRRRGVVDIEKSNK